MQKHSPKVLLSLQDICHHLAFLESAETQGGWDMQNWVFWSVTKAWWSARPSPRLPARPPAMLPSPLCDKMDRICQGVALEKCQPSMKEKQQVCPRSPRPSYQGCVVTWKKCKVDVKKSVIQPQPAVNVLCGPDKAVPSHYTSLSIFYKLGCWISWFINQFKASENNLFPETAT